MHFSLERLLKSPTIKFIDGAFVDGKLPCRADGLFSEAYLHEFFPALSDIDFPDLEQQIHRQIPADLRTFLQLTNGCSLFSDSLSISGFVRVRSRTSRQPISLRHGNVTERSGWLDMNPTALCIGSYSSGVGSDVFLEEQGSVKVVDRRNTLRLLGEWTSMAAWLCAEIERMDSVLRRNPTAINPLNPIPAPDV